MMSEPETKIEIEDVLSSIRRLVSRDAGGLRPMLVTQPAPMPEPVPEPAEAECLVLTPALRIGQAEDADAEAEPEAPVCDAAPESLLLEEPAAEPVVAESPAFVAPLPEIEVEAPVDVEPESAGPLVLSDADVAPAFDATAPFLLQPSAAVSSSDIRPFAVVPPLRPMTEAEVLLAEAEAALAETGAVLQDASSAIDAAGETEEPMDAPAGATDLGDELSRLESTIAELEAAVAESGFEFEPDTGHPFALEPEAAVSEPFEEEVRQAIEAPVTEAQPVLEQDADMAEPVADPVAESAEAWGAEAAADEAAETEALAQQDHAAALQAEMSDPELLDETSSEEPGVGMDWAEATLNLARRTPPRRLAVSDAEEMVQTAATMRSSYEDLRDELAQDLDDPSALYSEELVPSYEDGLIDEAVLRDMVAQLVREELRGSLGERITQNVRKLVRREIQRALMGQDYD